MIAIHQEAPVHHEAVVRALNDRAFGQPQEGRVVDALRRGIMGRLMQPCSR